MNTSKRIVLMICCILMLLFTLAVTLQYQKFAQLKADQLEKLQRNSTVIQTREGIIEYAIVGTGTPVLMIHGAGGGYDQGLLLAKRFLPDNCKVIAISRFGYAGTPLGDTPTPDHQAALYIALLDALRMDAVNVVGVSDGGPSALKMSIRYPERVKSLTMIAAKSQTPPQLTTTQSIAFKTIFNNDFLFWSITEYFKSDLYSILGISKEVQAKMTDDEKAMAHEFFEAMHPISQRKEGIFNANVQFKELKPEDYPIWKISAPTLVIHAKDDTLQPFSYAEYTHAEIATSQLLAFESGGHMLFGHHAEIREAFQQLFNSSQEDSL